MADCSLTAAERSDPLALEQAVLRRRTSFSQRSLGKGVYCSLANRSIPRGFFRARMETLEWFPTVTCWACRHRHRVCTWRHSAPNIRAQGRARARFGGSFAALRSLAAIMVSAQAASTGCGTATLTNSGVSSSPRWPAPCCIRSPRNAAGAASKTSSDAISPL
jgi:hypothetical protein